VVPFSAVPNVALAIRGASSEARIEHVRDAIGDAWDTAQAMREISLGRAPAAVPTGPHVPGNPTILNPNLLLLRHPPPALAIDVNIQKVGIDIARLEGIAVHGHLGVRKDIKLWPGKGVRAIGTSDGICRIRAVQRAHHDAEISC